METKIAVFRGKRIRKVIHNNEWWFSVIDVIEVLAGTQRPRKYWSDLKKKINKEGYNELSDKIGQLKLLSSDGKFYLTDCVNTETMFRLIQSIPSPKAEPFKRWLARVGYERIKEIKNYEILTAEISKATFGVTPSQYMKIKCLKRENLRDHMDDFELIFTMLGERATTEIHRTEDSRGVPKLKTDAKAGGAIAGNARKELEKKIKRSIVSRGNFLSQLKK